jgi:hypothetical protein
MEPSHGSDSGSGWSCTTEGYRRQNSRFIIAPPLPGLSTLPCTPFHASGSCGALRCARIVCSTVAVRFSSVDAILFYDPFVNGHLAQRRNRTHVYRLQVGSIPTMLAGHGPLRGLVAPGVSTPLPANCVRAFGIHQSFLSRITGASEGSGDFNFLGLPPFFPFSAEAFRLASDFDCPPIRPASRVSMVVLYTYRLRLSIIIYK